jgi:hypothetical protein
MAKIEKNCVICGKVFHVWAARAETAKTCSNECSGKVTASRYAAERVEKLCPVCGHKFFVPLSHADRRECCSIRCANKHPDRKHSTRENHYLWNGGKTLHTGGYLYVRADGHPYSGNAGYVLEHRVILESRMRKEAPGHRFLIDHAGVLYLRPEIEVHHINKDKRDNALENLLACTSGAHQSIHSGKAPMTGETWPEEQGLLSFQPYRVSCTCGTCGASFMKKRSDVERGSGKYCSRDCYNKSRAN